MATHSGSFCARLPSGPGGPNIITDRWGVTPGQAWLIEAWVMRDEASLPTVGVNLRARFYDAALALLSAATQQTASIGTSGWQHLTGVVSVPASAAFMAIDVGEATGTGAWFVDDLDAGQSAWNAGAHSLQSYSTGCFCTARPTGTTTSKMFGLNNDPAVDANFTGINFAWRADATGALTIYENGILINSQGTYTSATVLAITYDSKNVVYLKDGVSVRTIAATGLRLFLDTSMFTPNAEWQDVAFGPMGAAGADGISGTAAQVLRLGASSQVFTYDAAGAAAPAVQVITFTANRQNIANASVFSTTPAGLTLGGSGDVRTLAIAAFGANQSVKVRVDAGGFFDETTVVKLQQGANGPGAVVGVLTNENHTLASDKDGVVGTYVGAVGNFLVFEGITDRTTLATFSIAATVNCTAQINTAVNTPVAGQAKGYYRVTAVSDDQASVTLRAVYNGVTLNKVFTVTRARQGIPGDGTNLLKISDWQVGTTGSQGDFNDVAAVANNAIVLGGAGTAPAGPFGISEPLWEVRPDSDGTHVPDGGWNYTTIPVDHRKTYRSTVWVRVTSNVGVALLYFGARQTDGTLNLDGSLNANPYFVNALQLLTQLDPNQWYLAAGIIHGSGYTGADSGFAGIYDPRTGKRVVDGAEFRMAAGATLQTHRCYHYDNSTPASRQWMARPRFEEVNGNEPSIYELMGLRLPTPWIERGQCVAGATSFQKSGGVAAWDSDISSVTSFTACHLQFKPKQNNLNFMVGLNTDPLANQTYTSIDFAWYCHPSGLQIYENGVLAVANAGTYTAGTEFGITYDGTAVRYYKDRVLQRTVNIAGQRFFLDSSFFSPGAACDVMWGPGIEFESTGTDALTVSAVPESRSVNADFSGVPLAGELPIAVQFTVFSGSTNVTAAATYSHVVSNVTAISNGGGSFTITNITDDSGYLQVTVTHGGRTVVKRVSVSLVKGGATATSQTTNTVAVRNQPTYSPAQAGPLIIPVGPGGTITLSARRVYSSVNGGTLAGKFQYRTTPGAGSFIDFAAEFVDPNGAFPGENAVLAFNQNMAGPVDGANWEFQFLNRRSAGVDVAAAGSTPRFTASWTT